LLDSALDQRPIITFKAPDLSKRMSHGQSIRVSCPDSIDHQVDPVLEDLLTQSPLYEHRYRFVDIVSSGPCQGLTQERKLCSTAQILSLEQVHRVPRQR